MVTSKKRIAIIVSMGVLALLSAMTAVMLSLEEEVALFNPPSPVDAWLGVGAERSKLEDALENQVITTDEYKSEKEKLIAEEDSIAKYYPRNIVEYRVYTSKKEVAEKRPVEYWIAIFSTFIASIGTISGMLLSWRSDRRAAIETELKILELQAKIMGREDNA